MARQKNEVVPVEEVELDQDRINHATAVMRQDAADQALALTQHDSAVRAVALQMGYLLPADCTDPDLIQRDISINMRRSVEACLEVGRGLAVLKTACPHGNFTARLDVLGMDVDVAGKFMRAAEKFSKSSPATTLKAIGNQSKLFELLILDADQVEELELTGQTGELTLDDIASMSRKELRAALRELRQDTEAKDELLTKKNEQIDTLQTKVRRIGKAAPDEVLAELKKEATQASFEAQAAVMGNLRLALQAMADHEDDAATPGAHAVFMAGLVGEVQLELTKLRDAYGLPDVSNAADLALAAEVQQWATDPK